MIYVTATIEIDSFYMLAITDGLKHSLMRLARGMWIVMHGISTGAKCIEHTK